MNNSYDLTTNNKDINISLSNDNLPKLELKFKDLPNDFNQKYGNLNTMKLVGNLEINNKKLTSLEGCYKEIEVEKKLKKTKKQE